MNNTTSFARRCTPLNSGNWHSSSNWLCGSSPIGGDTVEIPAGLVVTVNNNTTINGAPVHVVVRGTWRFNGGGAKVTLPCNSSVLVHSGGAITANASGNSQTIKICNTTYWSSSVGSVSGPLGWPVNTLPVEFVSFQARSAAQGVQLEWATAMEDGSSHFAVQRSRDVVEWEEVGRVSAMGHSTGLVRYAHTDPRVPPGTWYYRLVQVDLDGSEFTTQVVPVQVVGRVDLRCAQPAGDPGRVLVWGVPTCDGAIAEVVLPATGRVLAAQAVKGVSQQQAVTLPRLPIGQYMLRISCGEQRAVCRFMVLE